MPVTYENISTTTLASDTASVTFSSIPTTYTDLIVIVNAGSTNSGEVMYLQVGNGSVDTGSNYSFTYILGTGSAATSARYTSQTSGVITRTIGITTTTNGFNAIGHLMNYSNTTTNKTVLVRANATDGSFPGVEATVNLWRSTSAINTIKIFMGGSALLKTNATFTLYGIKAA